MKKINKYFLIGLITPIILVSLSTYGVWSGLKYIEARDAVNFNDGWEVGYMQGQIDQDMINSEECFNISKNPELNILLKKYFKDCKTAKIIWAIAQAESSGKQFAVGINDNGSMDGGWLQVNTVHKGATESKQQFIERMHDLEQNVAMASIVYKKQGLKAWVTYNTGAYIKYMK